MRYNIKGMILQPFHANVLFEGYNLQHNPDNSLTGRLVDVYGQSSIKGSLDLAKREMKFDKKYDNGPRIIEYRFEKRNPDSVLWIGEYAWEGNVQGESLCELYESGSSPSTNFEELARRLELSSDVAERWAKGIVQGMIKEGYLEEVEEPGTGRKLIKPI